MALGIWGGVGGLAVALGPLVGGAIVQGVSWHWIFWLNVPIGLVLAPLAWRQLAGDDGRGRRPRPARASGSRAPACSGSSGASCAGTPLGWASGADRRAARSSACSSSPRSSRGSSARRSPMLPMHFFRNRTFALTNVASLFMFFGMFGSIFFLAQFFQTVQHYSPLQSGLRILPWTAMPIFIAPIAGTLLRSNRWRSG